MTMSRKHYEALAEALNGAYPIPENNTPHKAWVHCVKAVMRALAEDNPRFDPERFAKAAGLLF